MRQAQPFDPIQVGEIDNFMFELTRRVGGAYILDVKWTCTLTSYSGGSDPDSQSRVIDQSFSNDGIPYRGDDGVVKTMPGFFAIAQIGRMPPSAGGGTYVLGYTAFLSDGRQITDYATVQCQLFGQ
jgi:hypothetical protein